MSTAFHGAQNSTQKSTLSCKLAMDIISTLRLCLCQFFHELESTFFFFFLISLGTQELPSNIQWEGIYLQGRIMECTYQGMDQTELHEVFKYTSGAAHYRLLSVAAWFDCLQSHRRPNKAPTAKHGKPPFTCWSRESKKLSREYRLLPLITLATSQPRLPLSSSSSCLQHHSRFLFPWWWCSHTGARLDLSVPLLGPAHGTLFSSALSFSLVSPTTTCTNKGEFASLAAMAS